MRSLTSENPYLPIGGMNPDANGITLRDSECVWMENLRANNNGARSREGIRGLHSFVTPPSFNHFHFFNNPNIAVQKLFGFDDRTIWEFVTSTDYDYWKPAESQSSLSNIFTPGGNVSYSKDSDALQEGFFSEVPDAEWGFYTNAVDGQFPLSGSLSYTDGDLILLYLEAITDVTVTYSDASTATLTGADWFYIPIPTGLTISHLSTSGNSFPRGIAWVLRDIQHEASFFSTTEVRDTDGIKLLCAGSNPPAPGVAESDSAQRVLFEYDGSSWTVKTLWQQLAVGRENTGVLCGATATDSGVNEVNGTDEILPGSVVFFTLENGEIGRSTAIQESVDGGGTPASGFQVFSLGGYLTEGESNSFIKLDGEWQLTFSTSGQSKFGTETIFILYSFKEEIGISPRHLSFHGGRLVMGNIYEDGQYHPWRVRSAFAGQSDLVDSLEFQDLLSYGLETVERLIPNGNSIFAFTREGIYRGSYDDSGILIFNPFWAGGTVCGRTVCNYNNMIYFLGDDDFYVFNGSMVQSLTKIEAFTRIKNTAFDLLDRGGLQKCFSVYYPVEKEVWFFNKHSENYPTGAWVYSAPTGVWSRYEIGEVRCASSFRESSFSTWQDTLGLWNEMQLKWNEFGNSSNYESCLLGRESSPGLIDYQLSQNTDEIYTYRGPYSTEELANAASDTGDLVLESNSVWWIISEPVGTEISWCLITRDFIYGNLSRKDRTLVLDFESIGDGITFGVNGDFSQDKNQFVQSYEIASNSNYSKQKYHPDFYDYAIRYALSGTGFIDIRWLQTKAKVYQQTGEA